MSNQIKNNTEEKRSKKKGIILALLLLLLSVLLIGGIVAAYYSDIFVKTGDITTGTLRLNGAYTFSLNGVDTPLENINNLNPGDVIVIRGTINNIGSKSAWIRDRIVFTSDGDVFAPYLEVYEGEYTQVDLTGETPPAALPIANGQIVSSNKVINGTIETESGGGYEYLNSTTYNVIFTVYFMPEADNGTQGKTVSLSATVQALQFRNNNADEPDDVAWATVAPAV